MPPAITPTFQPPTCVLSCLVDGVHAVVLVYDNQLDAFRAAQIIGCAAKEAEKDHATMNEVTIQTHQPETTP